MDLSLLEAKYAVTRIVTERVNIVKCGKVYHDPASESYYKINVHPAGGLTPEQKRESGTYAQNEALAQNYSRFLGIKTHERRVAGTFACQNDDPTQVGFSMGRFNTRLLAIQSWIENATGGGLCNMDKTQQAFYHPTSPAIDISVSSAITGQTYWNFEHDPTIDDTVRKTVLRRAAIDAVPVIVFFEDEDRNTSNTIVNVDAEPAHQIAHVDFREAKITGADVNEATYVYKIDMNFAQRSYLSQDDLSRMDVLQVYEDRLKLLAQNKHAFTPEHHSVLAKRAAIGLTYIKTSPRFVGEAVP